MAGDPREWHRALGNTLKGPELSKSAWCPAKPDHTCVLWQRQRGCQAAGTELHCPVPWVGGLCHEASRAPIATAANGELWEMQEGGWGWVGGG